MTPSMRAIHGLMSIRPQQASVLLDCRQQELNSSLGGDATVRSYQPLRVEVSEGFIHPDATEEQLRERGEGLSQRLTVHRGGILFSFRAGRGSRDWVEIDMRHSEINVYVAQEAEQASHRLPIPVLVNLSIPSLNDPSLQVDGANIPDSRPKAPKGRRDKKARPTGLSGQKVIIRLLSESEEPKAAPSNTSGDLTPVPSPPQAQGTLEIWLSPDDAKSLKSLLPPFCGPSLREHEPIGERASDVAGEKPRVRATCHVPFLVSLMGVVSPRGGEEGREGGRGGGGAGLPVEYGGGRR